ncbi:uncharacterized protein LOC122502981 isoform X2 [Leptopilina heterotoma]|uniref:uncharacterized protein LOC122502981 isoform X2 n=1 Tax=Leptopilina heterotoma TaxID=63436 RepID=UPI001CAA34C8|nr:uncharacterized protein LOC122502981 isoform X2 [Leptopilina heterotoma]
MQKKIIMINPLNQKLLKIQLTTSPHPMLIHIHNSEDIDLNHDSNPNSYTTTVPKKQKIKKSGWTKDELESMNSHFMNFIEKGNYPSTKEIKIFVKKPEVGEI